MASRSKLSIGALSKATGIPAETLRTWERRYGFPRPERTPSGHRRYSVESVDRLRLIAKALDHGHRASDVVAAEPDQLRKLVSLTEPAAVAAVPRPASHRIDSASFGDADDWLGYLRRLDGEALTCAFRRDWNQLGALRFVKERVGPFLVAVGEAWENGELDVFHEHFASERLRDFLSENWRPLSSAARGPRIVCSTLPGELHGLGLHMAAVALALAEIDVVFLGCDTPVDDIAQAVEEFRAQAAVISTSASAPPDRVAWQLEQLRRSLNGTPVVVGGGAVNGAHDGVTVMHDFEELHRWATQLHQARPS
jgi:methylmalonyl-CoA mutase cobalamin-binding subunit